MMTKNFGSVVKICVCMLIAMSLCFIPSCKKSPEEPADTESSQQSMSATPPETPAPSAEQPVAKAPEEPAEPETEPVAEEPAEEEAEEEEPAAPANTAAMPTVA